MLFVKVVSCLLLCAAVYAVPESQQPFYELIEARNLFEDFIYKYGRQYTSETEKENRFEIFKKNLVEINKLNMNSNGEVTHDLNNFADMTKEERKGYTGFIAPSTECTLLSDIQVRMVDNVHKCKTQSKHEEVSYDLPDSLDWREKKIVTEVKNQLGCGSCWTFGTTGNIESLYAKKYGKLVDFSEQQLVDCDKNNLGCQGGTYNYSFGGLVTIGGMMSLKDYPYVGRQGKCVFDKNKVVVKLKDCIVYDLKDEEQLRYYVATNGPVSISIAADGIFRYSKGILSNCAPGLLNHAVLIVGYGTENGTPYWIIKNSWGSSWGEKGYFRLKRNINGCGLVNPCAATAVIE